MELRIADITPALMIANEEYWIYYVLRDLLKVFPRTIVIDTGSVDSTLELVRKAAGESPNHLTLVRTNAGHNANKIGELRNTMRELTETHWMFLVDGDEIWREAQIYQMIGRSVPDNTGVVMVGVKQVQDVGGALKIRSNDLANRDSLFAPDIRWTKVDYPFEGYGLDSSNFSRDRLQYFPAPEVFCYHTRHCRRSSRDEATFFRHEKRGYYPYSGPFENPPADWLGEICGDCPNPYLVGA